MFKFSISGSHPISDEEKEKGKTQAEDNLLSRKIINFGDWLDAEYKNWQIVRLEIYPTVLIRLIPIIIYGNVLSGLNY